MMEGKIKQAVKLVDSDNNITGVHEMTDDVRESLQAKHPDAADADARFLLDGDVPHVEAVIFEEISAKAIQAAAKSTSGSGGPTKIDADIWTHVLCSKVFGKLSDELAEQVALLARRLCIEDIPHEQTSFYFDGRLVALKKQDNGVRPVGVGEALRRIVGKSVGKLTKTDVQQASGLLQTCSGLDSGIEAAIHAMAQTWEEEECEAVLLIDAENAFNSLNRATALHNVGRRCSSLNKYLQNSYRKPAKLHLGDGTFILSNEGCTQGDTQAMAMYGVSTRGLSNELRSEVPDVMQVWFADDNAGGGKIIQLKNYWDIMNGIGPPNGYYPKPSKSILIVKNQDMLLRAEEAFAGTGVQITAEGDRHIGAALGSENFKTQYVSRKIENWVKDVKELAAIAKEEPQCALSAFNIAISRRWSFLQRTVKNISHLFQPLEDAIRNELIPAIVGRDVSDLERRMLALPYRHGGLGMRNPVSTADTEYISSVEVTANLTNLIRRQETDLGLLDSDAVSEAKSRLRAEKEAALKTEFQDISAALDDKQRKMLECACEKGASSWLSALPLQKYGYVLNKQEMRDAICLRYGWHIPETPTYCGCGDRNSFDHIFICKKGGYVTMRHNALRDVEANLMQKVCTDVKIEPMLMPTEAEQATSTTADRARLDVSGRGIWSQYEETYADIMVTHPTAPSHAGKKMSQLYRECQQYKKRKYLDRIINIEKGTLTPLVFSTTGGMAPECERFNKRLAELIAAKSGEAYSHVMRHVRTRLRFALLRATLIAIRGSRGRRRSDVELDIDDISFNLMPVPQDDN